MRQATTGGLQWTAPGGLKPTDDRVGIVNSGCLLLFFSERPPGLGFYDEEICEKYCENAVLDDRLHLWICVRVWWE